MFETVGMNNAKDIISIKMIAREIMLNDLHLEKQSVLWLLGLNTCGDWGVLV